jgi:hypothetical protein
MSRFVGVGVGDGGTPSIEHSEPSGGVSGMRCKVALPRGYNGCAQKHR